MHLSYPLRRRLARRPPPSARRLDPSTRPRRQRQTQASRLSAARRPSLASGRPDRCFQTGLAVFAVGDLHFTWNPAGKVGVRDTMSNTRSPPGKTEAIRRTALQTCTRIWLLSPMPSFFRGPSTRGNLRKVIEAAARWDSYHISGHELGDLDRAPQNEGRTRSGRNRAQPSAQRSSAYDNGKLCRRLTALERLYCAPYVTFAKSRTMRPSTLPALRSVKIRLISSSFAR